MNDTDYPVLAFVEDFGASNFLAPLPDALKAKNTNCVLLAAGLSINHLKLRKSEFLDTNGMTAAQIIDRYHPRVVVCGTAENPKTLALALIDEGNARGIKTAAVVDMIANADKRFSGESSESLKHSPQFLFVPDEEIRNSFEQLGFPEERISVIGYPQFDFVRAKTAEFKQLPASDKEDGKLTIVFVAEPVSSASPSSSIKTDRYTLHGRGSSCFRTQIILEELIDAISNLDLHVNLVVRLHPKNSKEEFKAYLNEVSSLSFGDDPLLAIYKADLVVGMTSMLLQEAAWMGKPTLAVLPTIEEKKNLLATSTGLVPVVTNRAALLNALQRFSENSWSANDPCEFFSINAIQKMAEMVINLINEELK